MALSNVMSARVPLFTAQFPKPTVWPKHVELVEKMQEQIGTNTCWAAVAVAVAEIFGGKSTQCGIIESIFGDECCDEGKDFIDAECDRNDYLPSALGDYLDSENDAAEYKTKRFVKKEIDADAPIGVRINWNDSDSGHFVLITGYVEWRSVTHLYIDDPKDGWRRIWRHDRFVSAYDEVGTWHVTFETRDATLAPAETKDELKEPESDDHSCESPDR